MSHAADSPWSHSPQPAAPRTNTLLMVVSGIVSFLLWLAVVGQLVFVVPRLRRTFDEFNMKLPLLTEWVIDDSRWAVPAIAIMAVAGCIGFGRRSPWPWLFLLFLLPLVINVLVGVSLFVPYMELLDGLVGGGKK